MQAIAAAMNNVMAKCTNLQKIEDDIQTALRNAIIYKKPFFPTSNNFFSSSLVTKCENIFFPAYNNPNASLKTKISTKSVGEFLCRGST